VRDYSALLQKTKWVGVPLMCKDSIVNLHLIYRYSVYLLYGGKKHKLYIDIIGLLL